MESQASEKISEPTSADPDREAQETLLLARTTLAKLNLLKGSESDAQVLEAYLAYSAEQKARAKIAAEAVEERRRNNLAAQAEDEQMKTMRRAAARLGIDPSGISRERLERAVADRQAALEREQSRADAEARRLKIAARAEQLFAAAGCPRRHVLDLSAFAAKPHPRAKEIVDELVELAQLDRGYLVGMTSGRGPGKTLMATSVIQRCCERLMTCRYVKAQDLFGDLRAPFKSIKRGETGMTEAEAMAPWIAYDLLVIDEAHQRSSDSLWEQGKLINLIDHRYDQCVCTILIANQEPTDFSDALGDSITSRMNQTGKIYVCNWPSYREGRDWRHECGTRPRIPSGAKGL